MDAAKLVIGLEVDLTQFTDNMARAVDSYTSVARGASSAAEAMAASGAAAERASSDMSSLAPSIAASEAAMAGLGGAAQAMGDGLAIATTEAASAGAGLATTAAEASAAAAGIAAAGEAATAAGVGLSGAAGHGHEMGGALGGAGEAAAGAGAHFEEMGEHAETAGAHAHSAASTMFEFLQAEAIIEGVSMAFEKLSETTHEAFAHIGEVEKLSGQTAAALQSTKGASNMTAEAIDELSQSIAKKTGVEDESIHKGANMLLTFTAIRNGVGEGNKIFDQATHTITDMSVAMGQDASQSAIMLGKALSDPIAGTAALHKVGVQFSEVQKQQIKDFVAAGETMKAQKMILGELNTEFGGSAEAFGRTLPGAMAKSHMAWDDLTDALMGPALPYMKAWLTADADALGEFAEAIKKNGIAAALEEAMGPKVEAMAIGLAGVIASLLVPAIIAFAEEMEAAELAGATGLAAIEAVALGLAGELLPLVATFAAVAGAAYLILDNWETLKEQGLDLFKRIGEAATEGLAMVGEGFTVAGELAAEALQAIADLLLAVGVPALAAYAIANADALLATTLWAAGVMGEAVPAALAFATALLVDGTAALEAVAGCIAEGVIAAGVYAVSMAALAAAFVMQAIPALAAWVMGLGASMVEGAIWVAAIAAGMIPAVIAFGVSVVTAAIPAVIAFAGALAGFVVAAAPFIAVGAVIGAVAYEIYQNWDTVKTALVAVWNGMLSAVRVVYDGFKAVWDAIASAVGPVADEIGLKFKAFVAPAVGAFQQIEAGASGALGGMVNKAEGMYSGLAAQAQGAFGKMQGYVDTFREHAAPEFAKFGQAAVDAHEKAGRAGKDAADKQEKAAEAAAKAIENIYDKLGADVQAAFSFDVGIKSDNLKFIKDEIGLVEGAIKSLTEKGVGPSDERFKELGSTLVDLQKDLDVTAQLGAIEKQMKLVTKAFDDYDVSQANARSDADDMGIAFDALQSNIASTTRLVEELKKAGLDPASAAMQLLNNQIKEMKAENDGAQGLAEITREAELIGPSFDRAKAAIAVYKKELTGLIDSHVATAEQIQAVQAALLNEQLQEAANGVQHESTAIALAKLSAAYLDIQNQSNNLGDAFDGTQARLGAMKAALAALALSSDATQAQIDGLKQSIFNLQTPIENYDQATGKLSAGLATLQTGLGNVAKALGVSLNAPMLSAIQSALTLGQGIAGLVTGAGQTVAGFTSMATFITGTMIPAEAAQIGMTTAMTGGLNLLAAALITGIALFVAWVGGQQKAAADAATATKNMTESGKLHYQALADYAEAATDRQEADAYRMVKGAQAYAQSLYQQADALDATGRSLDAQADKMMIDEAATDKLRASIQALSATMGGDLDSGLSSALKGALAGTASLASGIRDAVKNAVIDGIVAAIASKGALELHFGQDFANLAANLASGDTASADAIIKKIGAAIPGVVNGITQQLAPISDAITAAFATPATDAIAAVNTTYTKAMHDQDFAQSISGTADASGTTAADFQAKIQIVQAALKGLHDAGADGSTMFATYTANLKGLVSALADVTAASKAAQASGGSGGSSGGTPYDAAIATQQQHLQYLSNAGLEGSSDYATTLAALQGYEAQRAAMPKLAAGGYFDQATQVTIGEAGPEAAMPLTDAVFGRIGAGVAAAMPKPVSAPPTSGQGGGRAPVTLQVTYLGSGKWTHEDVAELGPLLVAALRDAGIKY